MKWTKFTTRELTEEEKELFKDVAFMWDSPVPDIGETVFVSNGNDIWLETWTDFDGDAVGLEDNDAEGLYWMSLPKLPEVDE